MSEEKKAHRHYDREFPNDGWYNEREKYHKVISLNGSGRSGKTTIAKMLAAEKHGSHVTLYSLRDFFERKVYKRLDRADELRNNEVFGMASLGWMLAEFHWRVKDYLNAGETVVFDHFFYEFYVEMMPESKSIDEFKGFLRSIRVPRLDRGVHFYLDIDYRTYQQRSERLNIDETKLVEELQTTPKNIFNDRRKHYFELCETENLILIDAMTSETETYNAIVGHIADYYKQKGLE